MMSGGLTPVSGTLVQVKALDGPCLSVSQKSNAHRVIFAIHARR